MRATPLVLAAVVFVGLLPAVSFAQLVQPVPAATVPRVLQLNGVFQPADGAPAAAVEEITLGIYAHETGGVPLWHETQSLAIDAAGRYVVLLGATQQDGVPMDVFASGEPRFLGLVWTRTPDAVAPRVRLTSVPYALRASDADTLGGLPASAFLRTDVSGGSAGSLASGAAAGTASPDPVVLANTGTANYLGKFVNAADLTSSALFETNGQVGLGTTTPFDALHTRFTNTSGSLTGVAVQNMGSTSTSYSGMLFYDHTGALGQFQGFNNATKEYRINNIAKIGGVTAGSINFMIDHTSRFKVRTDGDIEIPLNIRRNGDLFLHSLGTDNTALGLNAMSAVTSGAVNTAVGYLSLGSNTTGSLNTGIGGWTLASMTTGSFNTAVGGQSMQYNTSGSNNTAFGSNALALNSTGNANTVIGSEAMLLNDFGAGNTAVGYGVLFSSQGLNNTAIGVNAFAQLTSGNDNVAIGRFAGGNLVSGDGNLYLGAAGASAESNATYIRNVFGSTASSGTTVFVNAVGKMGTLTSSRRFKDHVEPIGDASEALQALRPVSFYYTPESDDGSRVKQYGLIAEEVDEVMPDLVVRNADGTVQTVRYHFLAPLLLAEVQRLGAEVQRLERERVTMTRELAELRSLVERVIPR